MKTRILIVDDHADMRKGLAESLRKNTDLDVVGEAEDGHQAVKLVDELAPDIVIMDVVMPGLNGIEATRLIKEKHPEVEVVGLSVYPDRRFATEMLEAGALGYVLKNEAFQALVDAIHAAKAGKTYLSPGVAEARATRSLRTGRRKKGRT
ncbi:MAG: response regulator transcription factor [Candidatus Aminicenantales bacterium]